MPPAATAAPDVLAEKLALVKQAVMRAHPRVPAADITVTREGGQLVARVPTDVCWVATVGAHVVALQRVDPTSRLPLDGAAPEVVPLPPPVAAGDRGRGVDPRALVTRTAAAVERLRQAFGTAHAQLRQIGETVEQEARTLTGGDTFGDRRVVVRRASDAEGKLLELLDAVQAGRDQVAANAAAVAQVRAQLAAAGKSVLIRDVEGIAALKTALVNLTVPTGELEVAISEAVPFVPAFTAAVARRVHAAAIAARQLFVGDVTRRLTDLRQQWQAVTALRGATDEHDEALAALVARAAQRSGVALPVPRVEWPAAKDVFQGPTLKD